MSKIAINYDIEDIIDMLNNAWEIHPDFISCPSYLISPNKDGITWDIVGLGDIEHGYNYYPKTYCPNCGDIDQFKVVHSDDDKKYQVYCKQCYEYCNDLLVYNPLPEAMNTIAKIAMQKRIEEFHGLSS